MGFYLYLIFWYVFFLSAAPIFLNINDGPHDVDVTTGDNVIVNCDAYANPAPTVQWFRNGQPFDSMCTSFPSLDLLALSRIFA